MHDLGGVWVGVLDLALLLAGLAVCVGLVVPIDRRRRTRSRIPGMPPRLDRGRQWELVMRRATKELARGPRVEELQADATVTIESAEYAYNRMVIDCAKHCNISAAPTFEPTRELAREPDKAPIEERPPLAA